MTETSAWPDLAGRLVEDGHVLPVRVYYEDTDFSGIVYHAAYLKFMERGRSDFLRLRGVIHTELDTGRDQMGASGRLAFAVSRMEIDFLRGARIDDILEVHTTTSRVGGARIVLAQNIRCQGQPIVRAQVTVALIDGAGKPRRIPVGMAARLLMS